jgi:adenylosuccinate synthase
MIADVIVDLQYGDCGKGKVTHYLCKNKRYTHVLRYNGGCNAGHTIYHEGKKFVTHHIPAGVFFGIKSIIGSGCVVNVKQFFKELAELKAGGIDTEGLVYIAKNAHVITSDHLLEEIRESKIGTTKRGNGPAYRDKYFRKGTRAENVDALDPYMIDLYEEFHGKDKIKPTILCEGAQGFGLDVDWGDYPFVTSSHCTTAGALLNAIPHSWVRDVWGVAKMYETYVGTKKFEGDDPLFQKLRDCGEEYGATTGRPRQCNWMDFSLIKKASTINEVNKLVINKVDVLRQVGAWKLINNEEIVSFEEEKDMKKWIRSSFNRDDVEIFFSEDKTKI